MRRTVDTKPRTTLRALWLLMALASPALARPVLAAAPLPAGRIDFERDVRPILAQNCFACHGFDAKMRQAGLRLDVAEEARKRLAAGRAAVVPRDPEASELLRRVTARDARRMPPAATGKELTAAQIGTLRRWIEQGAPYAEHWAFVAPKRPPLPRVRSNTPLGPKSASRGGPDPMKNTRWPRNPIDRFILARLEKEGLQPSPEADRATLIRRVTLDLTGLPPTPADVSAFLTDRRPDAYERLVDRLLASPHYGERMALMWLDLARYADTHGYHIDSHRDMWPWRDWVINAFNRDLPFDRFTVEQLAGDLLPNATREQRIATGFNRNHPINFEGGAIPEEYQAAYVFDRVDTTATTWMALTMRCAQCHDHKYDPITQQEYYRFYAYFNTIAEQGLDGRKGNAAPILKLSTPEQQAQLDAYDRRIAALEQSLKARAAAVEPALAAWEKDPLAALEQAPTLTAGLAAHYGFEPTGTDEADETGWLRDRAGRQPVGVLHGRRAWDEGRFGRALKLDGETHVELGVGLDFDRGDPLSFALWIRPSDSGDMTALSRIEEGPEGRGWDLSILDGKPHVHLIHQWDQNAIHVYARNNLTAGVWTHLLVTYDGSGKAKGVRIYVNGRPATVEVSQDTLTGTIRASGPLLLGRRPFGKPFRGLIDEVRIYDQELTAEEAQRVAGFEAIRQIAAAAPEKRTKEQAETLRKFYLENLDEPYRGMSAELAEWNKKRTALDEAIPSTMVMQEMEQPRETFFLVRGQYDQKGEKVTPGVPAFLPPLPPNAPPNRLALARWLVDPAHPLTARVAVNRFWQLFFGVGLVRTSEDFGTQSERPSHPELLDWLAVEFMAGNDNEGRSTTYPQSSTLNPRSSDPHACGGSMKKLVRLIVTSATYRQSSHATPSLLERDPENRLLARAPRLRLPAEFIRDQALAVSGLLMRKIGGPSVKPYHPKGLWEEIAYGGGFTAQTYEQDHGEALYRRSIYTFWKRTVPPPALQTFDAPEREFCMVRRSTTNTPLQALVLMNDPTYVEAARKFAERIMTEVAALPKDRIRYAFRLALARAPQNEEIRVLLDVYTRQLAAFRADRAAAEKLLGVGESPRNPRLDTAQLAAWTGVASVILNLDEMITRG